MPRMMLICATRESRIFSDWRFCAITASKRRFSTRTPSSRDSSTRRRVLWVMNSSRPPPTTITEAALAVRSQGFLTLAKSPWKSGSASLKPAPPPAAFFFLPGSKLISIMRRASAPPPQSRPRPRTAVSRDVHVGHFGTDVDQPHDSLHRVGMVQLERVVDRERVHVDDRRLEPGLPQQRRAALHQLALGGHEQHVHLQPLRIRVEDLKVELHVGHVERHVLLGLPADHFPGVPFLHPVHLDLLDDHVPAPDRRDHRLLLHPSRGKETPDRFRYDPGVHDLPLHDGIGGDFGGGYLHQLRLAAGMVDHGDLDDAGADVQAHRGFFAAQEPKKSHQCLGVKDKMGRGQTTVSPAPYPVKPRTYLRPNQQVLCWPRVRPLKTAAPTPATASSTLCRSCLMP